MRIGVHVCVLSIWGSTSVVKPKSHFGNFDVTNTALRAIIIVTVVSACKPNSALSELLI